MELLTWIGLLIVVLCTSWVVYVPGREASPSLTDRRGRDMLVTRRELRDTEDSWKIVLGVLVAVLTYRSSGSRERRQ